MRAGILLSITLSLFGFSTWGDPLPTSEDIRNEHQRLIVRSDDVQPVSLNSSHSSLHNRNVGAGRANFLFNLTDHTLALLFDPEFGLFKEAVESQDTHRLSKLFEDARANRLTVPQQPSPFKGKSTNITLRGEPSEPSIIDRDPWKGEFERYRRDSPKVSRKDGRILVYLLGSRINDELDAAKAKIHDQYNMDKYELTTDSKVLEMTMDWTVYKIGSLTWDDMLENVLVFATWLESWTGHTDRQIIPGCSFFFTRRPDGATDFRPSGIGSFFISRASPTMQQWPTA